MKFLKVAMILSVIAVASAAPKAKAIRPYKPKYNPIKSTRSATSSIATELLPPNPWLAGEAVPTSPSVVVPPVVPDEIPPTTVPAVTRPTTFQPAVPFVIKPTTYRPVVKVAIPKITAPSVVPAKIVEASFESETVPPAAPVAIPPTVVPSIVPAKIVEASFESETVPPAAPVAIPPTVVPSIIPGKIVEVSFEPATIAPAVETFGIKIAEVSSGSSYDSPSSRHSASDSSSSSYSSNSKPSKSLLPTFNKVKSLTDYTTEIPKPLIEISPEKKDQVEGEAMYSYGYFVKDDSTQTNFGHREIRNGTNIKGKYSVILPDGRRQIVNYYVANGLGYVADVTYEGEITEAPFKKTDKLYLSA